MKLGEHVIIKGLTAEVIQIKWNMIKVRFLITNEIQWHPTTESERVDK